MDDRFIECALYGSNLKGLKYYPLPGILGEVIYNHTSEKAWQDWLIMQTKMINESKLDPLDPQIKSMIMDAMLDFLKIRDFI